ncbi:MAG: MarC family protein, partial [Gammaproteobacteria bacterium]|nr:MarC family protein [Gammaproteobacteria bacterium]
LLGLTPQIGGVGTAQTKVNPIAIGIFPMAVPLYAGPGTISTVMVYAHEETHSSHDLIVTLLIATVGVVIIVGLLAATMVSRLLGPLTQQVIDRLLGMIVGALGIEFILEGVETYFQL